MNMKKVLLIVLMMMIVMPLAVFAGGCDDCRVTDVNTDKLSARNLPIEDDLVNSDLFPKVIPSYVKENAPIVDDVVPYVKTGKTLKLWARKSESGSNVTIDDELVTPSFASNVGRTSVLRKYKKNKIEDNFAKKYITLSECKKIKVKNTYDFTKAQIPVQLKIIKNLSTRHKVQEGDSILFKTVKDVSINGVVLPKGTEVIGRVETLSASDKMGTPANIIVDNFYVKDNPEICLYGNVTKTGANRSIWVYPLYQAGNIMFYVAGFVFVPIHGGHAKISTNDVYTVFFETR